MQGHLLAMSMLLDFGCPSGIGQTCRAFTIVLTKECITYSLLFNVPYSRKTLATHSLDNRLAAKRPSNESRIGHQFLRHPSIAGEKQDSNDGMEAGLGGLES